MQITKQVAIYRKIDEAIIAHMDDIAKRGESPHHWIYKNITVTLMPLTHDFGEWQKSQGFNFDNKKYKNILIRTWDEGGYEDKVVFYSPVFTINALMKLINKYAK